MKLITSNIKFTNKDLYLLRTMITLFCYFFSLIDTSPSIRLLDKSES